MDDFEKLIPIIAAIITAVGAIIAAIVGRQVISRRRDGPSRGHSTFSDSMPGSGDTSSASSASGGLLAALVLISIVNIACCAGACVITDRTEQAYAAGGLDPTAQLLLVVSLVLLVVGAICAAIHNQRSLKKENAIAVVFVYMTAVGAAGCILGFVIARVLPNLLG